MGSIGGLWSKEGASFKGRREVGLVTMLPRLEWVEEETPRHGCDWVLALGVTMSFIQNGAVRYKYKYNASHISNLKVLQ